MMLGSVVFENKTPDDVNIWRYDAACNEGQGQKVTKNGGKVTVAVAAGTYLFGAWTTKGGTLYPANTNPATMGGTVAEGRTYSVVVDSGSISFSET